MFVLGYESGVDTNAPFRWERGFYLAFVLPCPYRPDTPDEWKYNRKEPSGNHVRALLEYVELFAWDKQMHGLMRIGEYKVALNGYYGNDGLPARVPWPVYQAATPLPDRVYREWLLNPDSEEILAFGRALYDERHGKPGEPEGQGLIWGAVRRLYRRVCRAVEWR